MQTKWKISVRKNIIRIRAITNDIESKWERKWIKWKAGSLIGTKYSQISKKTDKSRECKTNIFRKENVISLLTLKCQHSTVMNYIPRNLTTWIKWGSILEHTNYRSLFMKKSIILSFHQLNCSLKIIPRNTLELVASLLCLSNDYGGINTISMHALLEK